MTQMEKDCAMMMGGCDEEGGSMKICTPLEPATANIIEGIFLGNCFFVFFMATCPRAGKLNELEGKFGKGVHCIGIGSSEKTHRPIYQGNPRLKKI